MFNPYRENLFWGYLSISLRGILCTPNTIIVEVLALSPVVFYLYLKDFPPKNLLYYSLYFVTLISHHLWLKLSHFRIQYPYNLFLVDSDLDEMTFC